MFWFNLHDRFHFSPSWNCLRELQFTQFHNSNWLFLAVVSNVLKCPSSSLNQTLTTSQDYSNFSSSTTKISCASIAQSDNQDTCRRSWSDCWQVESFLKDRQPITTHANLSATKDGAEAGPLAKASVCRTTTRPATTTGTTTAAAVTHGTLNKLF